MCDFRILLYYAVRQAGGQLEIQVPSRDARYFPKLPSEMTLMECPWDGSFLLQVDETPEIVDSMKGDSP